MGWWNYAVEKFNGRDFKKSVKQRRIGICVEPAAKVDSFFFEDKYLCNSFPISPQRSSGHSWVQKMLVGVFSSKFFLIFLLF